MIEAFSLRRPFFELGPKVYLYGDRAIELALYADKLCDDYGVDIICTAQYTDIYRIAQKTTRLKVFAQHMDANSIGRGVGAVLPEALREAGAVGVLLNHAEKPLSLSLLNATIRRADEVGLATLVCAGSVEESAAVARLRPNIVLAESPALIGGGKRSANDIQEIERINLAVSEVDKEIQVLHGAGISDENDVYQIVRAGADGTGSTSAVMCAADPKDMLERMIREMSRAYRERVGN
ncbi:triose-phosphate isomerase [Mesorhizobium sp. B3-1-3]|uniref:triose-phosphate isomerase n=1 Tax=unclassified Mesorhizobium TaxID=325217 RepID=UPI001125BCCF|nr:MULTISPECIES: triose-phosphate isomerase [unclassified Mesorhizobium]TPI64854.1 triose-phosphate isomerase [Mesorhizobium sp. B3-1-3]TPI69636.1 triose-phosphate isomerase [Mesorhizobium sp. B3-1-8]